MRIDESKKFFVHSQSSIFRVPFEYVVKKAEVDYSHVGTLDGVDKSGVLIRTESDVVNVDSDFPCRDFEARFALKFVEKVRETDIALQELVLLIEELLIDGNAYHWLKFGTLQI